jgi:uncharacterized protein (DUF427 family)
MAIRSVESAGAGKMKRIPDWAREARAKWRFTGSERPEFARAPGAGQRSVWDFPRPPRIEPVPDEISVCVGDQPLARTRRSLRVLETGNPPTYYIPLPDVDLTRLVPSRQRSRCEWKGEAQYWMLVLEDDSLPEVAWSYPAPFQEFERLRDHFAFYPGRLECFVGAVRVAPQPGGFYGGWVTPDLVGPFKGEPEVGSR